MPLFRFQAAHPQGQKTSGVIEADSIVAAKDRLRQQQMIVTHLAPYTQTKKTLSLSPPHLLHITRMLSQLLNAGIPLYEAIVMIEEKNIKASFHPLLVELCDRIKKGETLSFALSHHPQSFSPIYTAMIKAGEESGSLATSLPYLVQLLEDKNRLKKQLIAATAYPLFLASFCIIVFLSLLVWVIPSLKNLFEGRVLHPLTHLVFSLSDFFLTHLSSLFALLALTLTLLLIGIKHPYCQKKWSLFLLKLPLISPIILAAATVRFCKTAALLLKGGSPLLQALALSRAVLKNQALEQAALLAEKSVSEGAPLSTQVHWMSSLASRMLAVGEKTGQIGPMLHHISLLSEEELTRTLQKYTSLLQPLLLLILGLLIGTVILSILIPLTDVSSILD